MSDRELLEFAAKAAGYEIHDWMPGPMGFAINKPLGFVHRWNPLTDDGDALRLAVALKIKTTIGWDAPGLVEAEWIHTASDGMWAVRTVETHENDPYAATRSAIVRAAASIGKEMK